MSTLKTTTCVAALAGLALLFSNAPLRADDKDDWGDVSGQFVLDGDIPNLTPIIKKGDPTAKDAAVCAAQDVPDQSLVVDEKTKGIANIFVYLRKAPKKIHPEMQKPSEEKLVFDQKGCQFIPRAMIVHEDQAVVVKSGDPIAHNTHTYPIKNQGQNFIMQPNDRDGQELTFRTDEPIPFQVKCDIHPWMKANWFVVDHPYAVVTDEEGRFEINGLPKGEHELRVWHESVGYINKELKVTVKGGEGTDLGVTKVPVDKFDLE